MSLVRSLAAVLLVVVLMAAGAERAFAHAALISAAPADGAVVSASPSELSLAFSEPVSPIALTLIAPDGQAVRLDRFILHDRTLAIAVPGPMSRGTHVLSWRVISEDGHPVGGSVVFSVGAATPAPTTPAPTDDPIRAALLWVFRIALYTGLFLGAGSLAYRLAVAPLPAACRRIAGNFMAMGLAAALASLGLQGLDVLDAPLALIASSAPWQAALGTSYALTCGGAIAACLFGLAALRTRGRLGTCLASLALVALGAVFAASGHAGTASPQWLTRPAVFVHAVAIAFWTGSLIPLALALRRRDAGAIAALHRFSRLIPFAIAPLIAAGLVLAVVQVMTIEALWTTAYGRVLSAKLALLTLLFGLACLNRIRLTTPVIAGHRDAATHLVRSIKAEIVLVLAVLAIVGLWRFTPPPRALARAADEPAHLHIHTAKAMADITMTPGRAGPVDLSMMVMTGDFGALDAKEVKVTLSNSALGIEPIERAAAKDPDGIWHVAGLIVPVPGRWRIEVEILISDFEMTRLGETLDVRP